MEEASLEEAYGTHGTPVEKHCYNIFINIAISRNVKLSDKIKTFLSRK